MKVHVCPGVSLVLWLFFCGCFSSAEDTKKCLLSHESASERKILDKLIPLLNRNFTVAEKNGYTYVFQLCGDADGVTGAGVIQIDPDPKNSKVVVGRYNTTKAIGGSDWVLLVYESGDPYKTYCNKANRKAMIMISCDRSKSIGQLEVQLEDRERNDCFYLFEMDTSAVCPIIESKLGAGAILLIVGFCLLAAYLIGGFLYQRFVVGAKGMDQIPHYAFWAEIGNLSADGCDFVCRSKPREEPNAYRGVATEPAEDGPEERDDHLLPM